MRHGSWHGILPEGHVGLDAAAQGVVTSTTAVIQGCCLQWGCSVTEADRM